jgi:fatty acid desaturase
MTQTLQRHAEPISPLEAAPLPEYLPVGLYPELKRRVRDAGLLRLQRRYYAPKILGTLCLVVGCPLLLLPGNTWLRVVAALYMAFVFAQLSFLGHDIGHHQVLRAGTLCTVLKLVFGNLLVGVSSSWWMTKHNQHHSHPNSPEFDPDVTLPVLAFTAGRARKMNRLQRLLVRYQYVLFVMLLLVEAVVLRFSSIEFLIRRRRRRWLLELFLIGAHLALYGWLVFHFLGVYPAIVFVVVHQMAFGLYMGSVFAPNHKGMATIESGPDVDFLLEQVLTSRNVNPGRVTDFLYGGLNYQIEHHLFPSMPRNRLRQAQPLVASFCAEHGIPYCSTSAFAAYRDIFAHLHAVSVSVGRPQPARSL